MNFIIKNIKKHLSLIVILLGGVCFFISNFLLKEILNPKDYGFYSIITTYLSFIYIYGMMGFEQVFLRFSYQKSNNVISTQKTQFVFVTAVVIITTLISFFTFNLLYNNSKINYVLLFLSTLSCIFTLFLFNIFRLNKNFILAQITSNGWKIGLIYITLVFLLCKNSNINLLINILLGFIILTVFILTFFLFKRIKFEFNKDLNTKDLLNSFFHFFISITSFSVLLFGDRFLIEHKVGIVDFGNYFYLTNIVLAPFTILQNYVGFKQLVAFKENLNKDVFKDFNKKITLLAIALSVVVTLVIFLIVQINIFSFDFIKYISTIGLLLILGFVRLYSSGVIAAFEAQTNIKNLKKTNLIVVLATSLIIIILVNACSTINQILIGFILIWFFRSVILRQFLLYQIENNQSKIR